MLQLKLHQLKLHQLKLHPAEIAPAEIAPAVHHPEEDTQKIIFPIEETQKTEPLRIQLSEDEPEREIDGSICLQCGGAIKPDDINCPHCQILIMRRYCSHCSKLIPDHSVLCPLCGKDVQEHFHYSKLRRAKVVIGTATGAVVVLLLLLFVWQQSFSQPTPIQENDANSPEITPNVPESKEKINLSPRPESLAQSKNEIRPKPKKRIVIAPAPKPSEESEIIEAEPTEIETGIVEGQEPDPSMPASTQRALELNDQQRILRGRFLNIRGYRLIKAGRPSEAIPLLEQSVRSFPDGTKDVSYAYALFNLGVAWRMAGRPDIAIPILEERLKINNQPEVVQRELMVAKRQARESGLARNQ